MPGVGSRAVFQSGVALAALASAVLGLGWIGTSWRGQPGPLALGTRAYAGRDFRRAADAARERLKRAPDDKDGDSVCWLAQRLGWAATSPRMRYSLGWENRLYRPRICSCWGVDSATRARRNRPRAIWEKGLVMEPDHPEMIEQLMIRDAAQNGLAEAAQLAERLAVQPGWELRGELELGTFRSEMSDPAGAVAVLGRAFERPEASRLDRLAAIHYREVLARSLLKTGRPREARKVLETVLEKGAAP